MHQWQAGQKELLCLKFLFAAHDICSSNHYRKKYEIKVDRKCWEGKEELAMRVLKLAHPKEAGVSFCEVAFWLNPEGRINFG